MTQHLLATVLGTLLGKSRGLRHFSVPVNLPIAFIQGLVDAANTKADREDFSFHVSRFHEAPDVLSPERAAELRSREDGQPADALIVAREGQSKELKTLETFVRVNPHSVPNGIGGVEVGEISVREVCEAIASLLNRGDEQRLAQIVEYVLSYLGDAYREFGSDDIGWKDAWWMHAMQFADEMQQYLMLVGDKSKEPVDSEIAALIFASAGLPSPKDTVDWKYNETHHGPKAYARRVRERWCTGEDAHLAVTDMETIAFAERDEDDRLEYPLSNIDWLQEFDPKVATLQHPMLAVAFHGTSEAWHVATETEFFDDISESLNWKLLIKSADGKLVEVPSVPGLDPVHYVVETLNLDVEADPGRIVLGEYFLSSDIQFGDIAISDIALETSPTKLDVGKPVLMEHDDGTTLIALQFAVKLSKKNNKWKDNPYKLTIRPVVRMGHRTPFTEQAQISLILGAPNELTYVLIVKGPGHNAKSKLVKLPDRSFELTEGDDKLQLDEDALDREIKLKGAVESAGVMLVGPEHELLVNERPHRIAKPFSEFPRIRWLDGLLLPDGCVLGCNGNLLTITLESDVQRPLSPIVAAAVGTIPGVHETGDLEAKLLGDPRGLLEKEWLAKFCVDGVEEGDAGLGFPQALMFAGDEGELGNLWFDQETGLHVVGNSTNKPARPRSLSTNEHTQKFWKAFHRLNLGSLSRGFSGITSHWPSRLRLLDLEQAALENYLDAFVELIAVAERDSALRWLLYPFSAIVFEPREGSTTGVLLSPLHPIRLAWAWSVQNAAKEAQNYVDDVVRLMRFVDGGNFPFVGSYPEGFGQLASSPLDSGPEELFVTWSYLRNVIDINAGSAPPSLISGYKFPSGTASGLDKGGVAAAINDYLRVYPYISELRVGVAAQRKRPRSTELDRAVVAELDSLIRGRAHQLPGGIKVFDSKNRVGPIPDKDELLANVVGTMDALARDDENRQWNFPFEWRVGSNEHVDIQFLEDSIVKVAHQFGATELPETGTLPSLPVRRGFSWYDEQHGHHWRSGCTPTADESQASGLPGFAKCLRAMELLDGAPTIWSEIPAAQTLQDASVNWTVAGSANLDPRILSKALHRLSVADKVLWEWRPPYLPRRWTKGRSSITAANPYTVIASLNADFKNQVKQELTNSVGREGEKLFNTLFEELGSRGVGIASLLSMGHQQSRGAVGFYLGFKLADWWERDAASDEFRVALPLDAVNPVFESLAQVNPGDERKKADLLLISARRPESGHATVSFIPVEIKNHAAKGEPHRFPATNSKAVKEAISQLKNSQKLINGVIEVLGPHPSPTLLNATMATILEIGVSLGAGGNQDLNLIRDVLASVATGAVKYEQLPGALFWFERHGLGHADAPFLVRKPTSVEKRALIFVDPERCFQGIEGGLSSEVAEAFVRIYSKAEEPPPTIRIQPRRNIVNGTSEAERPGDVESGNEASSAEVVYAEPTQSIAQHASQDAQRVSDAEDSQLARPTIVNVPVEEVESRLELIIDTLGQFNISVLKPSHVPPHTEGPASITYRVQPEAGVRPKRVEGELDSLKLALELARDQNIKMDLNDGCIEIDVPKKDHERYFVDAFELWEAWKRPSDVLEVPLGVDQLNQPVSINFSSSNSPHLLIGGTTGSGKSEALNTLLYGLVEHYSPDELRLLLVDPKGTEMLAFEQSPFLDADIGWDGQSAIEILDAAANEMDDRYAKFRSLRARSLPEFNAKAASGDRLPWWIIVLDEYADLTADPDDKKKIEHYLGRLAQKARAAGLHVIIATQKPTVDVVNTVLRSNLPAQLALRVRSSAESKVIMNEPGAETLNGKGDAFLKAEGRLIRLQCALYKQ